MVTVPTTQTAPVQTTTGTSGSSHPTPAPATPQDIRDSVRNALRRGPPQGQPGGGAGGGGAGGPPGPGPRPAQPSLTQAPQQPIAIVGDVRTMEQLPQTFTGDRTKTDAFIDEVKAYLNSDVAGFISPMKKVAFTLTLIKGPETAGWTRDLRNWLVSLDPAVGDIPAVWEQFLQEFADRFHDTQREIRARLKLEVLKMRMPEIDQYISNFEELVCQAGYTLENAITTRYFLKGLPRAVLIDVLRPPMVHSYQEIKERAVESTQLKMLVESILGQRPGANQPRTNSFREFRGCTFQKFSAPRQPRQPFFSQNNPGVPPNLQSNQGFISSNAPRWTNNTSVPMDIDRAPVWRSRGGFNQRGFAQG